MVTVVWDKTAAMAGSDDGGGNGGYNLREFINAANLGAATGNQIRVTVLFGTGAPTETPAFDDMFVGQAAASGHAYDFNGNQVRVTFSGANSINGGSSVTRVSDWVTLGEAYNNTKNYVFAHHGTNATSGNLGLVQPSGCLFHYEPGASNSATSVVTLNGLLNQLCFIAKIEIQAGGAAAYTLTAAQGAVALGGQVTKLAYGHKFPATLGTFALSGKAAGLAFGHKFAAVTGSFILNGQAAGLAFGHRLVAVPGAFALAGVPAILRYSGSAAILTALPGAFVLSGVAAKLAYARKFPVVTGTFTLSGQSATLSYARVMPAVKATFTLNGVAASLRTGRNAVAVPGAFVLNGQTVNFRYTRVFPATVGVFNLSSAPANLIWSGSGSKLLPAMRGQFVLNGQAAGSRLTRVMAALPGSFVLAGQAAGLRKDRNLSAAKGVFALLGNPANMIYVTAHDRVMPAQRGSLLLTGVNASLIANQLEKQPGPIEFGRPVWLRAW